MVVLSNPVRGAENEYNDWYNGTHVPDMLKVPGVIGAVRYRASAHQNPVRGESPYGYLALYDLETEDIDGVIATIASRVGTDRMRMSDAMSKDMFAYYFEPLDRES